MPIMVDVHTPDGIVRQALTADEVIESGFMPTNVFWAKIEGFDIAREKPLQVERKWKGYTWHWWCYVTKDLKDLYDAGQLNLGDFVTVEFLDDNDISKPLAMQKVLKTWQNNDT